MCVTLKSCCASVIAVCLPGDSASCDDRRKISRPPSTRYRFVNTEKRRFNNSAGEKCLENRVTHGVLCTLTLAPTRIRVDHARAPLACQ